MEPARARRGQLSRALSGLASGPGEPAALEREGEAVGQARRQPTLPFGRVMGSL